MSDKPRPQMFDVAPDSAPASVQDAPPVDAPMAVAMPDASPWRPGWGVLLLAALAVLFVIASFLWVWDTVAALWERGRWLGLMGSAIAACAGCALLILLWQEGRGLRHLRRAGRLRVEGMTRDERAEVLALTRQIADFGASPAARQRFLQEAPEILDSDLLLAHAERLLLADSDARARAAILRAARDVATVTALAPTAIIDAVATLVVNVRMLGQIARAYGGSGGLLVNFRLLMRVMSTLLAAGALSIGDDFIGALAGGGLIGKVSRRFGAGAVNGLLTARLGVLAMEHCRPLPFSALARPGYAALARQALGLDGASR